MVPTHLTDKHRESGQNLQREPPQTVCQQRQEHLIGPAFAQADPCSVRSQKAIRTSSWRKSMDSGHTIRLRLLLTLGIVIQLKVKNRACCGPVANRDARTAQDQESSL